MSALADIVVDIRRFLTGLAGTITWDILFYLAIGFELLMIVFFIIKSSYSYEMRMERILYKLNRWLNTNQFIDQNNLIEFNSLMKKTPKLLRYHWHQYMLYREKDPSFYMSPYNCIEKPLKTSSFSSNIKNLGAINYCIAAISFVIGLAYISSSAFSALELAQVLIIPAIIVILNVIFVMLLRARQDRNLSKFYLYFHYFDRKMDKAVTTMPEYVDFEVLFTKKEIKRGIPVLNEYLEKRARQEQEELEKARLNAVEHEVFDFSKAGIDGSLVLERAMKETETYLNFKQRTLGDIQQLESEVDSLKRNYENTQKDYQRKLQASKENVDRLRKQQEESTNRIESNYIKKQQQDEVKKQEQLERDFDDATARFNNEIQTLQTDITTKRAELEEHRKVVEDAMNAEYETFSKKVYDQVDKSIEERVNEEKQAIINMKDGIADELQQANFTIEAQKKEISDLRKALEKAGVPQGEFDYYNEALREEAKKVKAGKKNQKAEEDERPVVLEETESPVVAEEAVSQEEPRVEQQVEAPATEAETAPAEPQAESTEPVYDEYGGYYDAEGYYRYANGTYYDPQGNYHDEFGGYYDPQGNYFPPENIETEKQPEAQVSEETPKQAQEVQEQPVVEEQPEAQVEAPEVKEEVQPEVQEEAPAEVQAPVEAQEESKEEPEIKSVEDINIVTSENDQVKPIVLEKTEEENQNNLDDINILTENVEQIEEPKRKRGRPRKVQTEEKPVEQTEQKKRGRPRKTQTETQATEAPKRGRGRPRKVQTETEEPEKKKVGRPRKADTEEKKVGRPSTAKTATSKKVGRPKKVQAEETEVKSGAKRGRPRKTETESEAKPTQARRGRPRKTQTEAQTTEAPKTQAKRGRPKSTTSSTSETQPKTQAKRGRPKKQPEVAQEEVVATPKKRGRPRKTQDSLDEIKKLNEQILEENLKLQRQQAELNSALGITLSQLDIKRGEEAKAENENQPTTQEQKENEAVTVDSSNENK